MDIEEIEQRFEGLKEQYLQSDPATQATLQPEFQQIQNELDAARATMLQTEAQQAEREGLAAIIESISNWTPLAEIQQALNAGIASLQILAAPVNPTVLPEVPSLEPPAIHQEHLPDPFHEDPLEKALDWAAEHYQKEKLEDIKEKMNLLEKDLNQENKHDQGPGKGISEKSGKDIEGEKLINEFQQHVENGCMHEDLQSSMIHAAEHLFHKFEMLDHIPTIVFNTFQHAIQEHSHDQVKEILGHQMETHYGPQQRAAFEHSYQEHASQVQHSHAQQQTHQQTQQHSPTQQQSHEQSHSMSHSY